MTQKRPMLAPNVPVKQRMQFRQLKESGFFRLPGGKGEVFWAEKQGQTMCAYPVADDGSVKNQPIAPAISPERLIELIFMEDLGIDQMHYEDFSLL